MKKLKNLNIFFKKKSIYVKIKEEDIIIGKSFIHSDDVSGSFSSRFCEPIFIKIIAVNGLDKKATFISNFGLQEEESFSYLISNFFRINK